MKTKKTSIILTVVLIVLSLLVFGLSYLPIGLQGDLEDYFSLAEFDAFVECLIFGGGTTLSLIIGIGLYALVVFVIVMFIIALVKKRGAFALLDLLALILGLRAAMNLVYCYMINPEAPGVLAFSIALVVLCIFVAILPLLCTRGEKESHATAVNPLPSTIPAVEKKDSDDAETVEEPKADEVPAEAAGEPVAKPAEEPAKEETKAEEPTPAEAPAEVSSEPEAKEEPAVEDKPAEPEEKPDEAAEEPAPAVVDTPKEEPKEEKPDVPAEDDKIAKTEEKPMKDEKKSTKTASAKAAPKASASKPAPKAAAPKAAPAKAAAKSSQKASGKYEVYPEAGFFKYRLKANNGEILIVSNGYKTRDGAHKGIDTLVKAVATGVAKIVIDKNKFAQFRLYTASDSRLIVAGEYYPNAKGAQSALDSVQKFYKTDKIVDLDEIPEDEIREWRIDLPKAENNDKGKFEIYVDETKKFRGRLLANNGQLLFATAAYAAKSGVTGALEKVQKKFESHDVTVTCDKQGRYQFIVYADNGAVLVMGESYTSKDRAISAAKSSKNFSTKPSIIDVTKNED